VLSTDELVNRIEAVDVEAVRSFALRLCETGNPGMASVGPVKRLESRARFAGRFGRRAA
jgi:hypothetical protein